MMAMERSSVLKCQCGTLVDGMIYVAQMTIHSFAKSQVNNNTKHCHYSLEVLFENIYTGALLRGGVVVLNPVLVGSTGRNKLRPTNIVFQEKMKHYYGNNQTYEPYLYENLCISIQFGRKVYW